MQYDFCAPSDDFAFIMRQVGRYVEVISNGGELMALNNFVDLGHERYQQMLWFEFILIVHIELDGEG